MTEQLKTDTSDLEEQMIRADGPAVLGVNLVVDNDDALRLISSTSVPDHEGVYGRVVGFQNHPEHGTIAAVAWSTEDGGHDIRAFKLDELLAHNQEMGQNIPKDVKELGETALDYTINSGGEEVADSTPNNDSGIETDIDDNDAEHRQQAVLRGVLEDFGLSEDMDASELVSKIDNELERMIEIRKLVMSDEDADRVSRALMGSLDERQNQLDGTIYQLLEDFVTHQYPKLIRYLDEDRVLPKQIEGQLHDFMRPLRVLKNSAEDILSTRRSGRIEEYAADTSRRSLGEVRDLDYALMQAQYQLEDYRAQIAGYHNIDQDNPDKEELMYADERVKKWATELQDSAISQDRIKQIEGEMEDAIRVESGMIDDPNSPSRWFDDRIMKNGEKSRREGVEYSGRANANIGGQQHVAEIMSDMLRGKFNIEASNLHPIELVHSPSDKGDRVHFGKHRVAALAGLYGNNWQEQAKKLGIDVRIK